MNKTVFLITAIIILFLGSCNYSSFKSPKESFTVQEVSKMLKEDIFFVDVRDADELVEQSYDVKNIINIPLDQIEAKMNLIPKDKQVILVCQSGNRSGQAFEILSKKGFTNLTNMEGGMNAWIKEGLPSKTNQAMDVIEKEACCSNPNSKDCNPDGTCKTTSNAKEKSCCQGADMSLCAKDKSNTVSKATIGITNRLEIYVFHGTRQCETCKNMKKNTKATLEKYYEQELKSGKIVYQIIDVDDAKNEKLAEKFQATGTSLMVNKVVNGKDNISDWSDFAFDKANNAQAFMPELKSKINLTIK